MQPNLREKPLPVATASAARAARRKSVPKPDQEFLRLVAAAAKRHNVCNPAHRLDQKRDSGPNRSCSGAVPRGEAYEAVRQAGDDFSSRHGKTCEGVSRQDWAGQTAQAAGRFLQRFFAAGGLRDRTRENFATAEAAADAALESGAGCRRSLLDR